MLLTVLSIEIMKYVEKVFSLIKEYKWKKIFQPCLLWLIGYVRVDYLKFIQIRSFTNQQLKFDSVCRRSIMENWGPLIESH